MVVNKKRRLVAAVIFILMLFGCARNTDYLSYQDTVQSYKAQMTVKENGEEYGILIELSPESSRITFTSPENIKDLAYERANGVTKAICQDLEYEGSFLLPDTVFSLFCLDEEDLISAKKGENGNILTFNDDIILTLDNKNSPLCIECPLLTLNIEE